MEPVAVMGWADSRQDTTQDTDVAVAPLRLVCRDAGIVITRIPNSEPIRASCPIDLIDARPGSCPVLSREQFASYSRRVGVLLQYDSAEWKPGQWKPS